MAENNYIWYYRQIDENEKNIKKNLNHVANKESKEKPRFIVPENERYRNNIRVCKIPDFYENFKINSKDDFVITFQHLYTMQSSEEAGFYNSNSKWVHYHSLGKKLLYNLPQLLENPEIVLCSSSKEDIINNDIDNTTLACVLNQNVTLSVDGKEEDCPVVAMIKPNITDDKATVILTAYPKQDFERFLQKGIEQNRILYLKNKEALRRDYPVVETNRVATVPFIELLNKNNIANFKENVNLKRVENNGMALQTIPDDEKTIKVCNAAKRKNPASVMFFPERQRSVKLYTEVFETLDKTAIQNIPENFFVNSLQNFLRTTKKCDRNEKILFRTINGRITNTQRDLIKQTIRAEYELYDDSEEITDEMIISEFKDWSENPSSTIQKQILSAQEGENTMSNEEIKIDEGKLSPVEYLMQKVNSSGVKVHLSKEEMKSILDTGRNVQKMAVKYGTNQNIENEKDFSGYGTYVVSVNEENAKQLGIKIASRKYGGTFYINNRPLSEFLQEQKFSPYWNKQLELLKDTSIDELTAQILRADVKGNANLINEQNKLFTVLGLGLVEYKREQTFLYSVNIPDNDNTNYLFYDKAIGLEHANKINEQLEKLGVEWRVSRNDIGKNVYFNVLSQKVFDNNQKQASEFLKSIGYVGMEMSGNNYIVFNDKDMDITNRVQYMKDKNGEVYGFAYEGEIYADEDLVNSNVLAHEYTHIWDAFVQNNNPELWQRGKDILKGTSLWQSVVEDKNYENLKTDDEILSECHSRIVGDMAEKILENIAKRDGGLTRDQVIDWDKEVSEYVVNELKIKPELGEENNISESVKSEYLKEFLLQPMKDLMNEVKINQVIDINFKQRFEFQNKLVFDELDNFFDKGKRPKNDEFNFKNVPEILNYSGISQNEIVIKTSVINKAMKTHDLSKDEIKKTIKKLSDPVLIFCTDKSASENKKDSVLIITDVFANNGNSIALAINLDSDYERGRTILSVNQITSIHDRTLIAQNGIELIEKWVNDGNCRYVDDKKISDWQQAAGVYFPLAVLQSDIYNIHTKSNYVNEKFSKIEPKKWNLEPESKSAVSHLIDVSQIKADEIQPKHSEPAVVPEKIGEIKSIIGNSFTGGNIKLTQEFQKELIEKGIVKADEDFILVNELEANANGTKIKDNEPFVLLTTPVEVNGVKHFAGTKYYHVSSLEEPQKIEKIAEKETAEKSQEDEDAIIYEKTKIPEFGMITNHGLKNFKNMIIDSREESSDSYLLKSEDGKNSVRVTASTLEEIMSEPYQQKAMSYDEETKVQNKMIESQYLDYFKPRDNCANNFRHNLSVYCRKEANSPLDSLKIANSLIKQMSKEEKYKTKELLKTLCKEGQTINEVLVNTYNEAVNEVPLNEEYLNSKRYEKMIARPMYDTLSTKGEKIDRNFDLKIGDSVKIQFKADKVFGKGKESISSEVTIISYSKEGNLVTLMDGKKSFYDVPRDTFLKEYAHQEVKERKAQAKEFKHHSIQMEIGR